MASTSDPPAAGGGEASALAPSAEPPPLSSSSSKRRWSPSTWRYAIEEVQPELGSRPRSNLPHSSSSLRTPASDHALPQATSKSRPLYTQDHAYRKENEEPARPRNPFGNLTWGSTELSAHHAQPRSQDMLSKKKRPPHPQQHHQRYPQKATPKRRKDEDEAEEGEWDDEDGDDSELGHHIEERKSKRMKREMSPSELYYCDVCRAKAPKESKPYVSPNSPLVLSQDWL